MATKNQRFRPKQSFKYQGDDWWEWSVWIEGNDTDLDTIEYVIYTLHPTFTQPVRKETDRKSKFRLDTGGWGVFTIFIEVVLKSGEKIHLKHALTLEYPDGSKNLA